MATIDTLANRSSGSPIAGKAYFETSTNKFIVYNGSAWIEIDSDGTGAVYQNRWGASFDGSTDYLKVSSGLNLSGSSTVSLWFRRTGSVSGFGGTLICTNNIYTTGYNNTFSINLKNNTDLTFESYSGAAPPSGYIDPVATNVASTNTWYHLALVLTYTDSSTSSGQFYIDGSTVGNAIALSGRTLAGLNEGFFIGAYDFGNSARYLFPGLIDDVAIFDTALDQTAITALYGASPNAGIPSEVTGAAGWWRMGDDSNDTASDGTAIATITDSSGNGNDATQATASSQPTFKALDQSTTSVSFDGSNDTLSVNDSSLDLKTDFSISCWFNRGSGVASWDALVSWGEASGGKYRAFGFNANNNLTFNAYAMGFGSSGQTLSNSTWYHGVLTLSGTGSSAVAKVYVNGALDSTETGFALLDYTTYGGHLFGASTYGGAERFEGAMDDVAIFNSVLSASDVASLAASRGAHIVNDLSLSPVAYYRMGEDDSLADGDTVTGITDASGNGHHATQSTAANQPTASIDPVIYV